MIGIQFGPAEHGPITASLDRLRADRYVSRLWEHDGALWGDDPKIQATARERLGWLTLPEDGLAQADDLAAFAQELRRDGLQHALVLGMGGSSLAPEVLRETFGVAPSFLSLDVLDSTHPDVVLALDRKLDPRRTLYIVASKSGTTTEPLAFMEHFWQKAGGTGRQFVAITDPGTPLERLAHERGFRRVFRHPPDVGGRYAALTPIGLVPAACIGLDLRRLLGSAKEAADACRKDGADNPGLVLGAAIGAYAAQGRDKVTLVTDQAIATFGLWVEQLVAESTGKFGRGILPVEREPLGPPSVYGSDRLFVQMRTRAGGPDDAALDALEEAGHPVLRIDLADPYDLGALFFTWEFAVPVASTFITVEPFDQPNVQESKDNTVRLLKHYTESGELPRDKPALTEHGVSLTPLGAAAGALDGAKNLHDALRAYLDQVRPGDYVAITAYVPSLPETERELQAIRKTLRDRLHVATTIGFGPRFLHSTGQLHKGGANTGVFIQITNEPGDDAPVPGQPYGFATLVAAQAQGDVEALQAHGRRALRIDLGKDVAGGLRKIAEAVRE